MGRFMALVKGMEIPAYAGMTNVAAGMTKVAAGMTKVAAGMAKVVAGMTTLSIVIPRLDRGI